MRRFAASLVLTLALAPAVASAQAPMGAEAPPVGAPAPLPAAGEAVALPPEGGQVATPNDVAGAAPSGVDPHAGHGGGHGDGTGGGGGQGTGGGHGGHGGGGHGGGHHADPSKTFNWTSSPIPFGSGSYKSKDQYGGPLGDGVQGPHNEPETGMSVPFVLVLFNFGLLLFLLGWKAGPMAREMAAKRSDDIKNALEEAARLRQQAEDKLAEYSSKLTAAEAEIDAMIKDMRTDAEAERARIVAAAEQQAAALKKDAEARIAAEIEVARAALQREVVAAAAQVAEDLLRTRTTPADQAALVDGFLRDVATVRTKEGSPS